MPSPTLPVALAHGVALLYGFNTPSLAAQGGNARPGHPPWRFPEYDLVFKMRAKCPRAGTAIEVVIERGRGMLPEQVYLMYRTSDTADPAEQIISENPSHLPKSLSDG